MHAIDRLSQPQRVVIVITLGLVLAAVASCVVSLGTGVSGWYAYSPLTSTAYAPGYGVPAWQRLVIWLVLIAVWTLASMTLLKPSQITPPSQPVNPHPAGLTRSGERHRGT